MKKPGRHWWREFVTEAYRAARAEQDYRRDAFANGYAEEEAEFDLAEPRVTFKSILIASKGLRRVPA